MAIDCININKERYYQIVHKGIYTALLICICLFNYTLVLSQSSIRNKFFEADYALQLNNFEKALKLFKELQKRDPENAMYNYRVGQCYLNLPDEKKISLPYLERAVENISEDFKDGNFSETSAPVETYYLLAKAYHVSENIDKAIYYYNMYLPYTTDKTMIASINNQIKACGYAKNLITDPVNFQIQKLEAQINSDASEIYPVVSEDETVLVYLMKDKNINSVYYTKKENQQWMKPKNINSAIGSFGDTYPSSISNDKQRLYFTLKNFYTSDIGYSTYNKGRWTKIKEFKKPVNTKSWDSHAFESADGNELYFISDRKGGYGNLDLYQSTKNSAGDWDKPENLGNTINTPFNEIMPIISPDGKELYFCSEGHSSMGGYDIFLSTKTSQNTWSEPVNVGYPINTTDDNVYFRPIKKGIIAYTSLPQPDDMSNLDIYRLEIFSEKNPKLEKPPEEIVLAEITDEPSDDPIAEITDGPPLEITDVLSYDEIADITDDITSQPENHEITAAEDDKSDMQTMLKNEPENNPIDAAGPDYAVNNNIINEAEGLYTIQIMALKNPVRADFFKNIDGITVQIGDDGFYRYISGKYGNMQIAEYDLKKIKAVKYPSAFIRKFDLWQYLTENKISSQSAEKDNVNANKDYYTIQIMALYNPVPVTYFKSLNDINISYGADNIFRYTYKKFLTFEIAKSEIKRIQDLGYKEAFIRIISDISNY